jgi:hypothetical protein
MIPKITPSLPSPNLRNNPVNHPHPPRRCEKFGPVLFHVIPAKAGIQSRSERDFSRLQILWTPVFTGETNRRQFFHSFPHQGGGLGARVIQNI